MSDIATQPATTRQLIEEAMRRIVDTRMSLAGSTWQHIVRFFRGDATKARVFYSCHPPRVEVTEEDGTPALLSCELTVRLTSNIQDPENAEHDQVCDDMLGLVMDATNFKAALNAAMASDYSDVFLVRYIEPIGDAETRVEGKKQISEVLVTIWLPPAETALAWAAAQPQ